MSSVQKRLNKFLYEASAESRSKQFSQATMLLLLSIILINLLHSPIILNTLSKKIDFTLMEEVLELKEPPKDKKFEVYFTDNSDLVYQILKPKPVVEPKIEKAIEPPPPPPPPKPKPKPTPKPEPKPEPKPVVQAKVATPQEVIAPPVEAAANQSEFATSEEPGASGDQILAELLHVVNKHKTYPRRAQRQGKEGKNFLAVTINPDGKITEAKLAKGMGYAPLDDASEDLAKEIISINLSAPKKTLKITVPIEYAIR